MASRVPLSYGQLSVLRYIEGAPHLWIESNSQHLYRLPKGVDTERVLRTLEELWSRHTTLRTTYGFPDTHEPFQLVHTRPQDVLEFIELGHDNKDLAWRFLSDRAKQRFTLTDDFGWHVKVMTVRGQPTFLGLSIHHIVADGWSLRRLEADFQHLLKTDVTGLCPVVEVPVGPGGLAIEQRSAAWSVRRAAARKYWLRMAREFGDSPRLGTDSVESGERICASAPLDRMSAAVTRIAKAYRVLPQGVILALFTLGLGKIFDTDRYIVLLMSSNRFIPPRNDVVTSNNQYSPMGVSINQGEDFSAFLLRIQTGSLEAYRNGSFDVDAMEDLARSLIGYPGDLQILFNYTSMGWPDAGSEVESDTLPELVLRVDPSNKVSIAALYFIVSGGRALNIEAHADSGFCTPALAKGLISGIHECLRVLSTGTRLKVRDLMSLY
jgi:hypothetical protein